MSPDLAVSPTAGAVLPHTGNRSPVARFFSGDNRYLPPILITTILLVGQNSLITRQETRQFARVFRQFATK